MPLVIEQHRQERCLVLSLQGSLMGAASAEKLRSSIREVLAENQKLVLLDVSGLGQVEEDGERPIDDFGIESILAAAFMTSYAGGVLRVFGASSEIAKVFEQADASDLLARGTTEEACAGELLDLVPDAQPFDILQFVREEERENTQAESVAEPQA